ncbi:MAG: hypothetical protein JNN00_17690 [Chitinophagaceae bacterium]|nr:hypothetical protein [Chitinophagaceae bacterium]
MEEKSKPNNPFVPDNIEIKQIKKERWKEQKKKYINHRTFELAFIALASIASLVSVIISYYSLKSTNRSLSLVEKSNASNDSASKISQEINQKMLAAADSSTKAAFELATYAKVTADVQLNSLVEQRKQFDLVNKPWLQIEIMPYDKTIADWPMEIEYTIKNMGKVPIKITHGFSVITFTSPRSTRELKDLFRKSIPTNIFITGNSHLIKKKVPWPTSEFGEQEWLNLLESYELNIYFVGFYYYVNLINSEVKKYEFIIQLTRNDQWYLHNINIPVNGKVSKEKEFDGTFDWEKAKK